MKWWENLDMKSKRLSRRIQQGREISWYFEQYRRNLKQQVFYVRFDSMEPMSEELWSDFWCHFYSDYCRGEFCLHGVVVGLNDKGEKMILCNLTEYYRRKQKS